MLHIETAAYTPGNYIRQSDLEPTVRGNRATVYAGKGGHRSWGTPRAESQIILNTRDQASVLCSWSTKHSRGQCWFHYTRIAAGTWTRKTWAQLTDRERSRILEAPRPNWANVPGKLATERKTAATAETALKVVRVAANGYTSLYDGETRYEVGETLTQIAKPEHAGGFYAYRTTDPREMEMRFRFEELVAWRLVTPGTYAVVEVELAGRRLRYDGGKVAASHITILRERHRFTIGDPAQDDTARETYILDYAF